jgi:hypothetical protein
MCRPVVAECKFIAHTALSLLLGKVRSTPSRLMSRNKKFLSLQMTAQCGLHLLSSTETSISENDLFAMLTYVKNRCAKHLQLFVGSQTINAPGSITNRFASKTSASCYVLTAHLDNNSMFGLIGGVVKGEVDSLCCALPQAIQISCDFLYHAVHVLQLSVQEVAIPFIIVAGGEVQFGAVYSLEHEFYPVPILITPPMSLYHLGAVYPVLEGLVDYVDNYLMKLNVRVRVLTAKKSLLYLNPRHYFLKPLQLFFNQSVYAHHRLHQLLALFDALFACEALRSIVVFPVGFIAFPDRSNSVREFLGDSMINGLEKVLGQQLIKRARVAPLDENIAGQKRNVPSSNYKSSKRQRNTSDMDDRSASASDRSASDYEDTSAPLPGGYPIIVYPRLDVTWQMAGTTNIESGESVVNVPETHRKGFYGKVCDAVQLMAGAGVCHLDMRLSNIFFRVDNDEVQIKIIDFDFAHSQDHVLPKVFLNLIDSTTNAYPPNIDVAGNAWQQFMLRALHDALGLVSTDAES